VSRKNRRKSPVRAQAGAVEAAPPQAPQTPAQAAKNSLRQLVKRPIGWVLSLVVAALAAVAVSAMTSIPEQLMDVLALKDSLRSGDDFTAEPEIVYLDDQGRSMVTKDNVAPGAELLDAMSKPGAAASPDCLALIKDAGGIDLGDLSIRVGLQGRRNQEIRIVDIGVVIQDRSKPWQGTLFGAPPQGGTPTMQMIADLDKPKPVFGEVNDEEGPFNLKVGAPFFAKTWISLKDREPQELILRTFTRQHHVSFKLEIKYRIGDGTRTKVLDNNGKPFEVTAEAQTYARTFELQGDFSYAPANR
jgi:hypothetical protein